MRTNIHSTQHILAVATHVLLCICASMCVLNVSGDVSMHDSFLLNNSPTQLAGQRVSVALAISKWSENFKNRGWPNRIVPLSSSIPTDDGCTAVPTSQLYVDLMVGAQSSSSGHFVNWPYAQVNDNQEKVDLSNVVAFIGMPCTQALSTSEQLTNLIATSVGRGALPSLIPHLLPPDSQAQYSQTGSTQFPSFFFTTPSATPMAKSYLNLVQSFGWQLKNIGVVIYDPFDGGLLTNFQSAAKSLTGSPSFAISVAPKPNQNYSAALTTLANSKARVFLFVNNYPLDYGSNFIEAAYDFGLMGNGYVWIVTNPYLCSNLAGVSAHLQSSLQGIWCPMLPDVPSWFASDFASAAAAASQSTPANWKINTRLNNDPRAFAEDYDLLDMYFNATSVALDLASSTSNSNVTLLQLQSLTLATLINNSYNPLTAGYLAAPFHLTQPQQIITIGVIKPDGMLHPVIQMYTSTSNVTKPLQTQNLTNLQFTMGSSSGQWSNVYFIGYPDASGNTIPPDVVVPIVIYTYFDYATSQSLQTAFVAIGGVLIGLIIILAAVITKYREHSVIKASSFSFNLVILLGGIGLCCAAIIFTQTTQSNGALCEARAWVTLISIQLLLAPLFMRTHRIARIFVQTELKIVNISNERLLAGIASIVGLQASILLIWTLIPAERSAYTTDDVGSLDDPLNHRYAIVHSCHYSPTFFAINTAFVALECLLGAIVGWRVRDVTMGEFNESLHIFVVMAFACAYGVILLPVQFMLSDPSPLLVLRAAGLEFAVCICIGVLFIPKLLLILQRNRAVRRSQQHDANHTVLGKNSSTLTPVLNGTTLHGLNKEGSTHREKRTSSTVLPKAKFGSPSVTASTLVGAYSPQLPRHTLLSKNSPPPTTLMMQSLTNTPIPQHRDLLQSIVLQMYPAQQMQHNELAPLAVSGTFTHDTEAAVHGRPTISVESTEIGSAMGSGATASGESTSTVRAPNATPSPSTPNRKRIRVHVNALTNMPLEPIISNSENTTGSNPIMSMDDNASNPI